MLHDISPRPSTICSSGFCAACNTTHTLGLGNTLSYGHKLIEMLDTSGSIDLFSENRVKDTNLSTAHLWEEPRGKMFGILECVLENNSPVVLYAFSGQFNGQWLAHGWVPPVFDVNRFHEITCDEEKKIKKLGREIDSSTPHTQEWLELRKQRRNLSRALMKEIHALYSLTNFKGETQPLTEVFQGPDKIPTGTGDCCAPKLLNYAAKNNLKPTGICEFFYGRRTKSGSQTHGQFSPSCAEKCEPILGFMLCGLGNL